MDETIFEYKEGTLGFDPATNTLSFKLTKSGKDLPDTYTGVVATNTSGELVDIGRSAKEYINAKINELQALEPVAEEEAPAFDPSLFTL